MIISLPKCLSNLKRQVSALKNCIVIQYNKRFTNKKIIEHGKVYNDQFMIIYTLQNIKDKLNQWYKNKIHVYYILNLVLQAFVDKQTVYYNQSICAPIYNYYIIHIKCTNVILERPSDGIRILNYIEWFNRISEVLKSSDYSILI